MSYRQVAIRLYAILARTTDPEDRRALQIAIDLLGDVEVTT